MQQTTIARAVEWRGIGLHSGRPATVRVAPAPVDTGLVFVALEAGPEAPPIRVRPDAVHSTDRAMVLAAPCAAPFTASAAASAAAATAVDTASSRVATVEHLLAALYALGIHNARIEVTGGEIPVLDGSALPFVTRLRRAGRRLLAASRRELAVTGVLRVGDERRWIRIEPAEGLEIAYSIEFPHPVVGRQSHVLAVDPATFEAELAPARTFGFADEVEALRAQGLARGGDLANTLVIGEDGFLNPDGLRWPDELVRHKIVDLLGDLALLEAELHARITVEKGGHGLHFALVKALVEALGPSRVDDRASERGERTGLVVERKSGPRDGRLRAASQPG